ncbi:MAG TPA: tetratricopeptide repeat protein, partial [Saprospiraceae bacterium]|nr:tetratricopeptide repeat protein [Saprospiraceae bacterium]
MHNFFSKYQRDSITLYLRMIDEQLALVTKPTIVRAQWLYEKGRFAFNEGDYAAALTFSQRGLEYILRYFPDQIRLKYLVLNTIGIGYRRTGQTDEAIAHYEDLLATSRAEADQVKMTGAILNNLGLAYKDCGDWAKAIRCLSDAIHYYAINLSPTYEDIGSGYDNIAICYQLEGRLDSALLYSRKSLDFIKHNLGARHPDLLLPMCSMMRTYLDEKNLKPALALHLEAIALLKDLGWHEDNPEGDYYLADGFDVFAYGREIYRDLYDLTQDTTYLTKAITDGGYFMAMTDYAYDNLKNDLSRELFQLKHGHVFAECINDLYTLNQIHPSTSLIEKA